MIKHSKAYRQEEQKPLIINRPEALSSGRRGIEWLVTTVGWVVWIFLLRPLLITLLWVMGFRIFFHQMIHLGGIYELVDKWQVYVGILLAIFITVRGWNVYNFQKFGKKNRRQKVKAVSEPELDEFFKIAPAQSHAVHHGEDISIDFLEDHKFRFYPSSKKDGESATGYFIPS